MKLRIARYVWKYGGRRRTMLRAAKRLGHLRPWKRRFVAQLQCAHPGYNAVVHFD